MKMCNNLAHSGKHRAYLETNRSVAKPQRAVQLVEGKKMKKCIIAAGAALFMAACGNLEPSDQNSDTGDLSFTISGPGGGTANGGHSLRQALSTSAPNAATSAPNAASLIKSVFLVCTGVDSFTDNLMYHATSNHFPMSGERVGLRAGAYHCTVTAYDNETGTGGAEHELYKAGGDVTIVRRTVIGGSSLILILQQVRAPGTVTVQAPRITAITVDTTLPAIYEPVALVATVDPTASGESYQWTATCVIDPSTSPPTVETAVFSSTTSKTTNMTFNKCAGVATVTFKLTNPPLTETNNASLVSDVSFTMTYVKQGAAGTVDINSTPDILWIRADPDAEPAPGQVVNITAGVNDPDGNSTLTYAWTASCTKGGSVVNAGSFDNSTLQNPHWTASSEAAALCSLGLTVDDHKGKTNTSSISLMTEPL